MRKLGVIGLFICLFTARAAEPMHWNKGSIVEKNGQVSVGEIAFQSVELILFRTDDNKVMVYTPFHLRSFFYFDNEFKINRKYSTLSIERGSPTLFFEIVIWGDVQVVRLAKTRNLIKRKLNDANDFNYFVNCQGIFTKIEDFKKEVFPSLVESTPILEQYVQDMKLTTSYLVNVFSIIKLYNKIINNELEVVARNN